MKYKRQSLLMQIIRENKIGTHERLVYELEKRGINVTQATVSRDIQELGIIKKPTDDGYVYTAPDTVKTDNSALINGAAISVRSALHTVVVKTRPGMAGGIAAVIDAKLYGELLGSVAGDDTVIIVTESEKCANSLCQKITELFGVGED